MTDAVVATIATCITSIVTTVVGAVVTIVTKRHIRKARDDIRKSIQSGEYGTVVSEATVPVQVFEELPERKRRDDVA